MTPEWKIHNGCGEKCMGKFENLGFFYVLGKWMYRCWLMGACVRKDFPCFFWHFFQTRSPIPKHPIAKSQIDVWKSMFIDGKHMHRWRSGVVCTWKMYFWFEKGSPSGSKNHLYTHEKTNFKACFWKIEKKTLHSTQWTCDLGWGVGLVLVLFCLGVCCVLGVGCNGNVHYFSLFWSLLLLPRARGPTGPGPQGEKMLLLFYVHFFCFCR